MSTIKKTISVNKHKQLIDLNGDKINYELNFSIKSKDDLPFELIVVSQSTLDSGEKLDYKNITNGFISGNIVSDKNVYQNYFLLLKSENPTECYIEITIKDIPVNKEFLRQQELENNRILQKDRDIFLKHDLGQPNFKRIIIFIIIIVIGILLYYYFFYNKKPTTDTPAIVDTIISNPPVLDYIDGNSNIETNILSSNYPVIDNSVDLNIELPSPPINPLLEKINNMKFY